MSSNGCGLCFSKACTSAACCSLSMPSCMCVCLCRIPSWCAEHSAAVHFQGPALLQGWRAVICSRAGGSCWIYNCWKGSRYVGTTACPGEAKCSHLVQTSLLMNARTHYAFGKMYAVHAGHVSTSAHACAAHSVTSTFIFTQQPRPLSHPCSR